MFVAEGYLATELGIEPKSSVLYHWASTLPITLYEPLCEKTGLGDFQPGPT